MKKQSDFEVIYHEMSARHGQLMSAKQVCDELGVSRVCYAKKLIWGTPEACTSRPWFSPGSWPSCKQSGPTR